MPGTIDVVQIVFQQCHNLDGAPIVWPTQRVILILKQLQHRRRVFECTYGFSVLRLCPVDVFSTQFRKGSFCSP